jgi:hypothetical protein
MYHPKISASNLPSSFGSKTTEINQILAEMEIISIIFGVSNLPQQ